jgi:hypothetical protein
MTPILYIAGPMSGLPDSNYPAFFAAEERLRAAGYNRILNPARAVCPPDSDWHVWMRSGIDMVLRAEALVMLPGSDNSRGARLERYVAEALGMRVAPLDEWLKVAACYWDDVVARLTSTEAQALREENLTLRGLLDAAQDEIERLIGDLENMRADRDVARASGSMW